MIFTDTTGRLDAIQYRNRLQTIAVTHYPANRDSVVSTFEALPVDVSSVGVELRACVSLLAGALIVCAPCQSGTLMPALYRVRRCTAQSRSQYAIWAEMLAIHPTEEVIRQFMLT